MKQIDKVRMMDTTPVSAIGSFPLSSLFSKEALGIEDSARYTVFPGFWLTLAKFFLPKILFIIEDFPTFDLPIKATSGILVAGYCSFFTADNKNNAL